MTQVVVAPEARDDLAAAVEFIAQDNPAAAVRLVDRVVKLIELLAEGSLDGPAQVLRSGIEVRSWPLPPFRLYYRREPNALVVLRVYHQARRPLGRQ